MTRRTPLLIVLAAATLLLMAWWWPGDYQVPVAASTPVASTPVPSALPVPIGADTRTRASQPSAQDSQVAQDPFRAFMAGSGAPVVVTPTGNQPPAVDPFRQALERQQQHPVTTVSPFQRN